MFGSLVLAVVGGLFSGVPAADQVLCPSAQHATSSGVPQRWFQPSAPSWEPEQPTAGIEPIPTTASDAIGTHFARARWFQSYAGASSNGTYALYDSYSGALYECAYQDTAHFFGAWSVPQGWVANAIPIVDAGLRLRTARGIGFGSTHAAVERVYGATNAQMHGSASVLVYRKERRLTSGTIFITMTVFIFSGDRLVGIERTAGI